ncbi:MAG: lipid II flippase MurJ [Mycobacteriales bacterium]|nr:lipid II flippase MurJ [Mycobacteriales bacterium]
MRTQTLLGAAAGIAVVTVAARVVGFGRTAVLAQTVGASDVGDTYTAVNALPNVLFEVAAGGALAAVAVPLVAGAVAAGDRATVDRTVSALLSWTLAVLLPVALGCALAAPLLVRGLLGDDATGAGSVDVGARMLRVFAPQVVLYGVAVVLIGVLQAHRRFLAAALAPLVSSLVVITTFLLYAGTGPQASPADLTDGQVLLLAGGTTAGVLALAATVAVPLRTTGVRLRPSLSFPPGVAARARGLAGSGVASLLAQQVSLLVALRLAADGAEGTVVVYSLAVAVFLLPWAVLAVPVATSAFPRMSEAATQEGTAYAEVVRSSLRAAVGLSALGAVALLVLAGPVAALLLLSGAPGLDDSDALRDAIRAFAPGLVGHGAAAVLGRALLADGRSRSAAAGTASGWLAVALGSVLLARLSDLSTAVALGLASSAGLTLGAVVLGSLLRQARRG